MVHPRWRGEHALLLLYISSLLGSSPLARGTLLGRTGLIRWSRFIPAGAGNTSIACATTTAWTVHPRWRGEHQDERLQSLLNDGSSPLARGTPQQRPVMRCDLRFIPAGAGNTRRLNRTRRPFPVHPRWRGEHGSDQGRQAHHSGSSPLARGTPAHGYHGDAVHRFIPAGAGNTQSLQKTPVAATVHPRWRGEHGCRRPPSWCRYGSSPLARGTRNKLAR